MNKINLKISISEEHYNELRKLAEKFNLSVEECIEIMARMIAVSSTWIEHVKSKFKVPVDFAMVLSNLIIAGFLSFTLLCDELLSIIGASGYFSLENFELDIDENRVWLKFVPLEGSNLPIDYLEISFGRGPVYMEVGRHLELTPEEIEEVRKFINDYSRDLKTIHEFDLILAQEEDTYLLILSCIREHFNDLPNIKDFISIINDILRRISYSL